MYILLFTIILITFFIAVGIISYKLQTKLSFKQVFEIKSITLFIIPMLNIVSKSIALNRNILAFLYKRRKKLVRKVSNVIKFD